VCFANIPAVLSVFTTDKPNDASRKALHPNPALTLPYPDTNPALPPQNLSGTKT